jgi:hypothetical protein
LIVVAENLLGGAPGEKIQRKIFGSFISSGTKAKVLHEIVAGLTASQKVIFSSILSEVLGVLIEEVLKLLDGGVVVQ